MENIFSETCDLIANNFPEKPFHLRGRINYAAMDSIFNAVAKIGNNGRLDYNYKSLIKDPDFIETSTINTSDGKTLYIRFMRAIDVLSA